VPELGVVWLFREVVKKDIELIDGGYREMIWANIYYAESASGPFTELLEVIPYSFNPPPGA